MKPVNSSVLSHAIAHTCCVSRLADRLIHPRRTSQYHATHTVNAEHRRIDRDGDFGPSSLAISDAIDRGGARV